MTELDRRELLMRGGAGAAAILVSGQLELARAIAGPQARSHVGSRALRALERAVSGRVLVRGGGNKAYHRARKVYNTRFNSIDPKLRNWTKAYYGRNYDRLVQIKTRYDPDNLLAFKQGIKPR